MYYTNGLALLRSQEEKLKFEYFLWWKWTRNAKGKADVETKIKPSAQKSIFLKIKQKKACQNDSQGSI